MKKIHALILMCAGVVMCGRPESKTGEQPMQMLDFTLGQDTLFVIKVADSKNVPESPYQGEEEFAKAKKGGDKVLVHVLIPASLGPQQPTLSHKVGDKSEELTTPSLIYRMPNSPLRTFAIVDAGKPGRLVVKIAGGATATLILADATLKNMPLHWSGKTISTDMPSSLNGAMPH